MRRTSLILLLLVLLLQGCALWQPKEIPVAVACPPPPPVPAVLMAPSVSTEPSISERLESLLQALGDSLTKARR